MPMAIDPNQTFKIVLLSDQDKPKKEQPAFIFRHPTGRQWRQISGMQDALEECNGGAEVADKVFEAAGLVMVGWENMPAPDGKGHLAFDIDRLEDVIGMVEAQELIFRILRSTPDFESKKKLKSPSPSDTDSSAKNAQDS